MATPAPITTLTLHTSPAFLGVWAYLFNNLPPADLPVLIPGATNNWTPLIDEGQLNSRIIMGSDGNYNITITLTDQVTQTLNGGVIYLLVQERAA